MADIYNAEFDAQEMGYEPDEVEQEIETAEEDYQEPQAEEANELTGDEAELLTFTRVDENGEEVQEQYSQEEVLNMINAYKNGETGDNTLKQLQPFIEQVRQDDLMKAFIQYKSQGYSNAEIIDGMFLLRHPEYANGAPGQQNTAMPQPPQEEEVPFFETIAEEVEYHTRKAMSKELADIKNTLSQIAGRTNQYEQERYTMSVAQSNDRVIMDALSEAGVSQDQLDDSSLRDMYQNMSSLYPGVDMNTFRLTPVQAKSIVKLTFGNRQPSNIATQMQNAAKKPDTGQMIKTSKLPTVLPGTKPSSSNPIQRANASKSERLKEINKLFGW